MSRSVPTVKEVAALAGVSTATVSRVLSGSGPVSDELAEKVHSAARALAYKPNRVARNLRSQETHTVGVVIPDIENPFFSSAISGIDDVLRPAGYCLLLANYRDCPDSEQRMLETLYGEGVAGLIFTPSEKPSRLYNEMSDAGIALVGLSRTPRDVPVDTVSASNFRGSYDAVCHLLRLGHRRVGLLCGPTTSSTGAERLDGYRAAFGSAGCAVPDEMVSIIEWRQEAARLAMVQLLARPEPPTAVFAAGNLLTLGALQAIHAARLDIPRQIALVGFDDFSWATSLRPSLTTVSFGATEMGRTAAEVLLLRLNDPTREREHKELPTRLIVRASCGAQWNW
ncbi:MAG: LacI family DNA-binding transcriptional regulator [Bryobacteraceae bacterium]